MAIAVAAGHCLFPRLPFAAEWGRFWLAVTRVGQSDTAGGVTSTVTSTRPDFVDLFARYHLPLINYLYGMTRDRELAADLAQETFTRAYAAAPDLAGVAQPRAWLYRIATNVALNASRHRDRFEWLPLSRIEPESGGEADAWSALPPVEISLSAGDLGASVAERDAVWTVLAALPPRWRAILLLQTTAGFEVREIAVQLHLSEANVRKILFRAKERFRALYRGLDAEGVIP
jgi:RNA polymerase sigma-70 factor, ECF subfamily